MVRRTRTEGFTLIELLVVVAIIGVLIGLLLPAVQRVRDAANATRCKNNLKQLALAVHHYENINGTMPPYCNYNTSIGWNLQQEASYIIHLLPFLEHQDIYGRIHQAQKAATGTYNPGVPAKVVTPAVAGTKTLVQVASYNGIPAYYDYVTTGGTPAVYDYTNYVAAGWSPPGSGPVNSGNWTMTDVAKPVSVLRCRSDPSLAMEALFQNKYTVTNYAANWNAWGDSTGNGSSTYDYPSAVNGYKAPPQKFRDITDGLGNTVLFGEVYAVCDGLGRTAYYSRPTRVSPGPFGHFFGITWPLSSGAFGATPTKTYSYGMPNTLMFQVRPMPMTRASCPTGEDCCSPLSAQTPHLAMPVVMIDGSVHAISGTVSQTTWNYLLQPRDARVIGDDY